MSSLVTLYMPKGNGTGKGGKSMQDRELAARVRTLALEEIERILKNKTKEKALYKAVIIKLAGTVLPRLNEHSGPDGDPIPLLYALHNHDSDKEDSGNDGKNTGGARGNVSE